jgi:membrane fusion protein (multidrug efflux system)
VNFRHSGAGLLLAATLLAAGCGEKAPEKKPPPPATLITTTQARAVTLEVVETTLGTLESVFDPKVAAEVAGRIVRVEGRAGRAVKKGDVLAVIAPDDMHAQQRVDGAEVRRLEAVLAQQERTLRRQTELQAKNFISRNAVDDATTQRDAATEQLAAAKARLGLADNQMAKTKIVAPYDGNIVVQIVAPGDYVKVGDPLFQFVSNRRIRANLPFPEQAASRIRVGQTVRLSSLQTPAAAITGSIEDIRPVLLTGSRAIEAIARFDNTGGLLSGGSVDASVVIARREGAVVVPEQSVVLRPAGKVVFAIVEGKAEQRVVDTGSKQGGVIEIVKGLAAGTTVALDGAGFLANGAAVSVKEPKAASPPASSGSAKP